MGHYLTDMERAFPLLQEENKRLHEENCNLKSNLIGQEQLGYHYQRLIKKYEETLQKIAEYRWHKNLIGADAKVMMRWAQEGLEPGDTIP